MGYRSDVGVKITLPTNKSDKDIIADIEKAINEPVSKLFNTVKADETTLTLGANDIKWYERCEGFEDITNFMEWLSNYEDNYEDGGIHYVRIGESWGDIEEQVIGDVWKYIEVERKMTL